MSWVQYKKKKLDRSPMLRCMNYIGMVAWRETPDGTAKQYLRLLHPLVWLWVLAAILLGVFLEGVPTVLRESKNTFEEETVWW